MSRTRRNNIPRAWRKPTVVRDGTPLYSSKGCSHNNSCNYCVDNRTHGNRRREPIKEST